MTTVADPRSAAVFASDAAPPSTNGVSAGSVSASEFALRPDRHSADAAIITSSAFLSGALFPSVSSLAAALRAFRAAGRTEDVVGFAIPLEGDDPTTSIARARAGEATRRGFSLVEFLMTAIDPHRPSGWPSLSAPGKNSGSAVDLLGDLTRWLVGIQPFAIHQVPGVPPFWVLGRPNHAAAVQKISGDAQEGYVGTLASFGVVASLAQVCAERLAAGDCLLTTCETDLNRARNDERLMRKAGAIQLFDRLPLTQSYGDRQA